MKRLLTLAVFLASLSLPSLATWTLANSAINYCGTSSTSCQINFTQTTTGSVLVAVAFYSGTGTFTTASTEAGTWVHPTGCSTTASGGQKIDFMYTLSASQATATTFNFSSAAGFADLFVMEFKGATPFTYGSCSIGSNPSSSTSINGGSITTTGASNLAVVAATASANWASAPTVSSPFTSPAPSALVNGQEVITPALNMGAQTSQAVITSPSAVTSAAATLWFSETSASVPPTSTSTRLTALWINNGTRTTTGGTTGGTGGSTTDFLAQVVSDEYSSGSTFALNDAHPESTDRLTTGVPSSYDWYSRAVVSDGNNPCASVSPCNTTMAIAQWGTVAPGPTGNPATNVRVNVRACTSWWYSSSTQQWTQHGPYNAADIDEEAYELNFSAGGYADSTKRTETDGSLSFKMMTSPHDMLGHFFGPYPRWTFPKAEMAGFIDVCQLRLIVDNSSLTDDRASAKILASIGADYYPGATTNGIANNNGIGGGKLKYITSSWRSFGMSTLTYAQIKALPSQPPIDLTGIAP